MTTNHNRKVSGRRMEPVGLIERLRGGDHKAFEEVFIAYYSKVKLFIKTLVHDSDDAERLTQDMFVDLWHSKEKADPARKLSDYIYILARNSVYNFLKSRLADDECGAGGIFNEGALGTDKVVFAKEMEFMIKLTVDAMPAQRRDIFEMSRYEGLSNSDIARKLNLSASVVENQLYIALKDIREMIAIITIFILD